MHRGFGPGHVEQVLDLSDSLHLPRLLDEVVDELRPRDLASTVKGGGDDEVIKVTQSANVTLRFLNVVDGRGAGVEIKSSRGSRLDRDCFARNREEGVELDGTRHAAVTASLIIENGEDGIAVHGDARENAVKRNTVRDNGRDGIDLEDANGNTIIGNTVKRNGRKRDRDSGIELEDSDRNLVDGNRVRGNADGLTDVIRCISGDENVGSNVPRHCR